MTETVRDAYRIVYNDIMNSDCGLMVGTFDAANANKEFMYGIATVMEWIADRASPLAYEEFTQIWDKNFAKSLDKARQP